MRTRKHPLLRPPALRALIIGYGNPLRGDDALGWRAAEVLAAAPEIVNDPSVRVETVHQLTPELAETIAGAEVTVFIDASLPAPGHPPGTVRCEEIHAKTPSPEALGHHLTPAHALAYASGIFDRKPRAFLTSVAAGSFDYGAGLSPAVEAAIPPWFDMRWTAWRQTPGTKD